jgi:hypothetical protein
MCRRRGLGARSPIAVLTWAETHGRAWTAPFPKHLAIAVGFENDPAFERKPPEEALLGGAHGKERSALGEIAGKSRRIGQLQRWTIEQLEVQFSATRRRGKQVAPREGRLNEDLPRVAGCVLA